MVKSFSCVRSQNKVSAVKQVVTTVPALWIGEAGSEVSTVRETKELTVRHVVLNAIMAAGSDGMLLEEIVSAVCRSRGVAVTAGRKENIQSLVRRLEEAPDPPIRSTQTRPKRVFFVPESSETERKLSTSEERANREYRACVDRCAGRLSERHECARQFARAVTALLVVRLAIEKNHPNPFGSRMRALEILHATFGNKHQQVVQLEMFRVLEGRPWSDFGPDWRIDR